jgi:peptidoglycan/LPS O-acetylase OafA/YrhL
MSNIRQDYRTDITGLRALAVSIVLMCHLEVPGFQFGFIGVDIFFVISGYLITRVLFKHYINSGDGNPQKSSLALMSFYLRRIRRLLPAAIAVIIVVNALSYLTENSASRSNLLNDSKWAALFLANIAFLRSESDYFKQSSEPSALQHYWSLGIEEQFYFVWPLLFLITASFSQIKFRSKYFRFNHRLVLLIVLVSVLSFLYLQFGFGATPKAVYFSIFTRAWELGVGSFFGILAFQKKETTVFSNMERYLPLFLVLIFSAVVINDQNWARLILLPVLATGYFLYSGEGESSNDNNRNILRASVTRFLVFIGTISYSLYLVHWPLILFASEYRLVNQAVDKFLILFVAVVAGFLLWKFVEVPFQRLKLPQYKNVEVLAFLRLKQNKNLTALLTLTIVASLYVATYPEVAKPFVNSDSNFEGLANDPAIKYFSSYQVSQGVLASKEETTTIESNLGVPISELESSLRSELKAALKQTSVPNGLISRLPEISQDKSAFERSRCGTVDSEIPIECSVGTRSNDVKRVVLLGDSKMSQFAQPLMEYFSKKGYRVIPYVMAGCDVLSPTNEFMSNCEKRVSWVKGELERNRPHLTVLATYPRPMNQKSNKNLDDLLKLSERTILLTQFPRVPDPKLCVLSDSALPASCSWLDEKQLVSYEAMKRIFREKSSSVISVVDTTLWACFETKCPVFVGDIFLTRDGSHLTSSYVKKITPLLNVTLDNLGNW